MNRPPNYEFQEWWNKHWESNQELFSNGATPNGFLTVEIGSPAPDRTAEEDRVRSARQLSWLWPLKFQQLASSLVWITNSSILLLRTANRWFASPDSPSYSSASRLYRIIKFLLVLVILLLCVELVVYFKGWHFSPPTAESAETAVELVYAKWLEIRADYLAAPLQSLANVCIVLLLVQSVDRVVLMLGCFWIKLRRLKPTASMVYPEGPMEGENVENYPMVLVQIPMCNEKEVYQQSIAAVCTLDWPKERMLVQVLDDSDELDVQSLIKAEVQKWQQRGIHIVYRHRLIRTGYKAGNLKSAMSCDYVKDYEFVAIFDAAFQPAPDFLKKTIPYFKVSETNEDSNSKRCKQSEGKNGLVKAEEGGNARNEKQNKANTKPPEPPKDYIHVRARRGQPTDSHSLAERVRREKISERMKLLQDLVPGCNKVASKALMLDEIINYVQSVQRQVEFLSMKLASVNTRLDFNMDSLMSKEIFQSNNSMPHPIFPLDSSAPAFFGQQSQQNPAMHRNISNGTISQMPVDPLDTVPCRSLNVQLPSLDPITDALPSAQCPILCEGDLQTIVQMGFSQNPNQETPLQSQNLHGSNQVSHMKVGPGFKVKKTTAAVNTRNIVGTMMHMGSH